MYNPYYGRGHQPQPQVPQNNPYAPTNGRARHQSYTSPSGPNNGITRSYSGANIATNYSVPSGMNSSSPATMKTPPHNYLPNNNFPPNNSYPDNLSNYARNANYYNYAKPVPMGSPYLPSKNYLPNTSDNWSPAPIGGFPVPSNTYSPTLSSPVPLPPKSPSNVGILVGSNPSLSGALTHSSSSSNGSLPPSPQPNPYSNPSPSTYPPSYSRTPSNGNIRVNMNAGHYNNDNNYYNNPGTNSNPSNPSYSNKYNSLNTPLSSQFHPHQPPQEPQSPQYYYQQPIPEHQPQQPPQSLQICASSNQQIHAHETPQIHVQELSQPPLRQVSSFRSQGCTARVARSDVADGPSPAEKYKLSPKTEEDVLIRELNGKLRSLKRKTVAAQSIAIKQGVTPFPKAGANVPQAPSAITDEITAVSIALPMFHPIHCHALLRSPTSPPGLECDICGQEIYGERYECDPCNFDMCSTCFKETEHCAPEHNYDNFVPSLPNIQQLQPILGSQLQQQPPQGQQPWASPQAQVVPTVSPYSLNQPPTTQNIAPGPSSHTPALPPPNSPTSPSVLQNDLHRGIGGTSSNDLFLGQLMAPIVPTAIPSHAPTPGSSNIGIEDVFLGMPVSKPQVVDSSFARPKPANDMLGAKEEAWLKRFEKLSQSIMEDEQDILALLRNLRTKQPATVKAVFDRVDLCALFTLLHDCEKKKFRTEACDLICTHLIHQITPAGRATIMDNLCPGRFETLTKQHTIWMINVICSNSQEEILEFKNRVDYTGMHRNMHKIVYSWLKRGGGGLGYKADVLHHISNNVASSPVPHNNRVPHRIKILSDVDDTFICSGGSWPAGCDTSYPTGTPYPGVFQFYKELDMGTNPDYTALPHPSANLVFITSRPCPKGHAESKIIKRLYAYRTTKRASLHTNPILMTGEISGSTKLLWGNMGSVAKKKMKNIVEYASLYPEYKCVWVGDSGQGDYQAALSCLEAGKGIIAAFIHKVTNYNKTFGYKGPHQDIHFFDTYISAAIAAHKIGLIDKAAVERVARAARDDHLEITSDFRVLKKMNSQAAADALNMDITTANATLGLSCPKI